MSFPPVIELWLCPLTQLDDRLNQLDYLRRWLAKDELAKVDRYRMEKAQTQALYVRSYLRVLLSRFYQDHALNLLHSQPPSGKYSSPKEWQFEYGEKGKPRLIEKQRRETGIEFNISHSQDHLLIAITRTSEQAFFLGVDIEHTRSSTNIHSIMKHYFSSQEVSDLLKLDENKQRQRFFDLWALKESYIKATGKGLATSLKSFGFDFSELEKHKITFTERSESACSTPLAGEQKLDLYKGIRLDFIDENQQHSKASIHSIDWQSQLGRLDDDYRFAVTVGGGSNDMQLKMHSMDSSELFCVAQ